MISSPAVTESVSASIGPVTEPFGAVKVASLVMKISFSSSVISPSSEVIIAVPVLLPVAELTVTLPVATIVRSPPSIANGLTVKSPVCVTFRSPPPVRVTFSVLISDSSITSSEADNVTVSAVSVPPRTILPSLSPAVSVISLSPTSIGPTITMSSVAVNSILPVLSSVGRLTIVNVPVTFKLKSPTGASDSIRT